MTRLTFGLVSVELLTVVAAEHNVIGDGVLAAAAAAAESVIDAHNCCNPSTHIRHLSDRYPQQSQFSAVDYC